MKTSDCEILYATGLVRPKTTALFFDKLWIPNGFDQTEEGQKMGIYDIPVDIRFVENKIKKPNKNAYINVLSKAFNKMNFYSMHTQNAPLFLDSSEEEKYFKQHFNSASTFIEKHERIEKQDSPLFSMFRNWGLNFYSQYFKAAYNINLVPIFFDKTEFENALTSLENNELIKFRNDTLLNSNLLGKHKKKWLTVINSKCVNSCNSYEVTIKNIPIIKEESLSWKQVIDMRKDKKSIKKLKKFRSWANTAFNGKSNEEIKENLHKMVEEYEAAIKKFEIKTFKSGFTTVLTTIASFLGAIGANQYGVAGAIISVGASAINFIEGIMDIRQVHNRPIAYYYDIVNSKEARN